MCVLSAEHTAPGQAGASAADDGSTPTPASTSSTVPLQETGSNTQAAGLPAGASPTITKGKKRKREDKREPPAWFQEYSNKSLRLQEAMVGESKLKNDLLKQLLEKL